MTAELRHDWTLPQLRALHDTPLLDLVFRAAVVHRQFHDPREMQVSKLISIKTGACPEDCSIARNRRATAPASAPNG